MLKINDAIFLSEFVPSDRDALVVHLSEKQIYDNTLRIPHPYTAADADFWLSMVKDETLQAGQPTSWAIREASGKLIGGIGFSDVEKEHKAEIGYWLAKPLWGQGIMTQTVRELCQFAAYHLRFIRVYANVFDFNSGSARVLEKAGFQLEGTMRNYYIKDGKVFDGKLYAWTTTPAPTPQRP